MKRKNVSCKPTNLSRKSVARISTTTKNNNNNATKSQKENTFIFFWFPRFKHFNIKQIANYRRFDKFYECLFKPHQRQTHLQKKKKRQTQFYCIIINVVGS